MNKRSVSIIHIVEAFEGGIIEFISKLVSDSRCNHVVIHGQRGDSKAIYPPEFYESHVTLILWQQAQREIKPFDDYKAYKELSGYLNETIENDTVLHLHSAKAGILGRLYSYQKKLGNLVIYTPNGAPFARQDVSLLKRSAYRSIEWVFAKLVGKIVCVSKSEADLYKSLNINVDYINNGTEPVKRPPQKNIKKAQIKTVKVVTVGRISEQKSPIIFNSIASAFTDDARIQFVWIGDGEQRHFLNSENILITGWMPKENVMSELLSCHLYLSTAKWEGLPFAVIEAMSLGLPLLLRECVGNVDLVDDSNGFLFKTPDNAINILKHLQSDSNLLGQLGEASYNKVIKEFNSEKMKEKYFKLYTTRLIN
jgi:glycosyltransferase involved in cell wall biosynthesis